MTNSTPDFARHLAGAIETAIQHGADPIAGLRWQVVFDPHEAKIERANAGEQLRGLGVRYKA